MPVPLGHPGGGILDSSPPSSRSCIWVTAVRATDIRASVITSQLAPSGARPR
ncbi:hypothetical protein KP002_09225 [Geomonas subterranea]|uniref:hypothetical protein n=1 Tax=Geomonas subterranea TaxID=2847989 RepID=UPI001C49233D|nr:hypothetical protein [Geomonas subterranea]QXM11260.1 hypothetical protein KP002_09225 [Geomonas subterranea]